MKENICKVCGKKFQVSYRLSCSQGERKKYCSQKCHGVSRKNGKTLVCVICGKKFYRSLRQLKSNPKYCSRDCQGAAKRAGRINICYVCGKKYFVKLSRIKIGNGKYCSRKCYDVAHSGANSRLWHGGMARKNRIIRNSKELRKWRERVLGRDNYICQKCGIKAEIGNGVYLHAHHIKSFAKYPKLRFDINNGITFCGNCHQKLHGWKFSEYIMT